MVASPSGQPEAPLAQPAPEVRTDQFIHEVPPTVATAPEPAGAPDAEQLIRDKLSTRNWNHEAFPDFDGLLDAIEANASQLQQLPDIQRYAAQGRRYAEHAEEFERWQAERQSQNRPAQAAPVTEQKPERKPIWNVPEYDEAWTKYATYDAATGKYVPADQYVSPLAAQKLNEHNGWLPDALPRLAREYVPLTTQIVDNRLEERGYITKADLQNFLQEQSHQASAQQQAVNYLQENMADLYFVDPGGRIQVDQHGQEMLKPKGQALAFYCNQAKTIGIQDPLQIQHYARQQLELYELKQVAAKPAKSLAAPAEAAAEPEPTFMEQHLPRGAAHLPSRAAPSARQTEKPRKEKTFLELAMADARERGLAPQTG